VAGSLRPFPYGCYVPCVMLAGQFSTQSS